MNTQGSYQNLPPIDMRPARFFQQLTTEQLIEQLRWAGSIIEDDARSGHRSMVEPFEGAFPMTIASYTKALRFHLHRREYHGHGADGGAV